MVSRMFSLEQIDHIAARDHLCFIVETADSIAFA